MSEQTPLTVIIVGAGLAGALAARVLREKHNVTIYERMPTPAEAGAAINVGPNGVRILDSLNFDRGRVGSLAVCGTKVYNKAGELTLDKYTNYKDRYGADWLFQHRADLRAEFLRLATAGSEDIPGRPAQVYWDCPVKEVDPEGKVILASGEEVSADLIIGADGIKSVLRPHVVADAAFSTARPSGLSAFRFTLEAAAIKNAIGELPDSLDADKPVCLSMVYSFDSTKRSIVMYPCRNFQLLNFVCIVPDDMLKNESTESWTAAGDKDELLSVFDDFPPWVLNYLKIATNIKLWQLRDQDPLPTYIRGRVVLIGDAAHAMTPHQGQGGTQAVEDAEGFRLFLQPGVSRDDVPRLLKDFDSVRRPRASTIQDNTRKAADKRTAEEVYMYEKINWTYGGIFEELEHLS
ncbi:FAD/NAD(P)-binding domain-containing protein [Aspergillus californicus]